MNYHILYVHTIRDCFLLPRVDKLLDHLCSWSVFTKQDLFQDYYFVRALDEYRYRTAFFSLYRLINSIYCHWVQLIHQLYFIIKCIKYFPLILISYNYLLVNLHDRLVFLKSLQDFEKHLILIFDLWQKSSLMIKQLSVKFV